MTTVLPFELATILPFGQQNDLAPNSNTSIAASQIPSSKQPHLKKKKIAALALQHRGVLSCQIH